VKTCFHCARLIKQKVCIVHVPPLYLVKMGLDFERAYHKRCWEKSETLAKEDLERDHPTR
jgi:hypothetical protein